MKLHLAAVLALALAAPGDPAKEYAALLKDSESTKLGYKEAYLAFKEKFEAFAQEHKGTEEAISAKLWLLKNTWWHREEKTMESRAAALADEILAEAPKSPQLARIPDYHYDFSAADKVRIFTKILEVSPHAEVKGSAILRLALSSKDPKRTEWLETLRKDYGDVKYRFGTFGELADAHLAPHPAAALEVGKPAPDIVGRDADGRPMKLSDFKGMVIVLDFFGDW